MIGWLLCLFFPVFDHSALPTPSSPFDVVQGGWGVGGLRVARHVTQVGLERGLQAIPVPLQQIQVDARHQERRRQRLVIVVVVVLGGVVMAGGEEVFGLVQVESGLVAFAADDVGDGEIEMHHAFGPRHVTRPPVPVGHAPQLPRFTPE